MNNSIKKVPCTVATVAENINVTQQNNTTDSDNCQISVYIKSNPVKRKFTHLMNSVKLARKSYRAMEQASKAHRKIGCYPLGYGFLNTVEGCTICSRAKDAFNAAQEVFASQPEEVRRQLSFAPKSGEFISRAHFWRDILKPALTTSQYYEAMGAIYRWYRHIIELQKTSLNI